MLSSGQQAKVAMQVVVHVLVGGYLYSLWADPTDTILDQSRTQGCKQALMGGVGRLISGQQTSSTTTDMPTETDSAH